MLHALCSMPNHSKPMGLTCTFYITKKKYSRLYTGGSIVARITVEDCLKRVSNRFLLANMASKRVRQIREGSEYLVSSPKNEDIVVSLREIAAGMVAVVDEDAQKLKRIEAAAQAVAEAEEVAEVEQDEKEGEDAAEAEEAEKEESK